MHLRTRLTIGVAATAAAVGALLVPTSAFAAPLVPNAQLTVDATSTASDLLDGQIVLLDGSGYAPSSPIYLVQCANLAQGDAASCDGFDGATNLDKVVFAQSDASGNISDVEFPVHTGPTGTAGGVCDATNPACGIAATDSLDPTAAGAHFGAVGITFAKVQGSPLTGLHGGDLVHVTGVELDPSITVAILQCGPDAQADGSGCDQDPADAVITSTDENGAFAADFTVLTGEMQAGDAASACPPPAGATAPCEIIAEQIDLATLQPIATLGILPIAFAPPPVHVATSLSITATKAKVDKGEKFAIKGRDTDANSKGVNGVTVKLQSRASTSGKWSKIDSTTTKSKDGKAGYYKFGGLTESKTKYYRVKSVKKSTLDTIYDADASSVVKVKFTG